MDQKQNVFLSDLFALCPPSTKLCGGWHENPFFRRNKLDFSPYCRAFYVTLFPFFYNTAAGKLRYFRRIFGASFRRELAFVYFRFFSFFSLSFICINFFAVSPITITNLLFRIIIQNANKNNMKSGAQI